jgi:hypothetical protein
MRCRSLQQSTVQRAGRLWRPEQPQVDRENRELEEAPSTVFEAEAMVARDMASYQAMKAAAPTTEALVYVQAQHRREEVPASMSCRGPSLPVWRSTIGGAPTGLGRQDKPTASRSRDCE